MEAGVPTADRSKQPSVVLKCGFSIRANPARELPLSSVPLSVLLVPLSVLLVPRTEWQSFLSCEVLGG